MCDKIVFCRRKILASMLQLAVTIPLVGGCSLQYMDEGGSRHVIGLSHTIIKDSRADRSEVVAQEVLTIGLAVLRLPEHSGVSVGYTKNFTVHVSSRDEAGELSLPFANPTDFRFSDFHSVKEGLMQ